MGNYICSLVQKSTNTNWRGRRSSSHEFTEVAVTYAVSTYPAGIDFDGANICGKLWQQHREQSVKTQRQHLKASPFRAVVIPLGRA